LFQRGTRKAVCIPPWPVDLVELSWRASQKAPEDHIQRVPFLSRRRLQLRFVVRGFPFLLPLPPPLAAPRWRRPHRRLATGTTNRGPSFHHPSSLSSLSAEGVGAALCWYRCLRSTRPDLDRYLRLLVRNPDLFG